MNTKIKLLSYNYTRGINYNSKSDDDCDEYVKLIWFKTKQIAYSTGEYVNKLHGKSLINLRKIWIPSDIGKVSAASIENAPFLGVPSTVEIFTDIIDENHLPIAIDSETGIETPIIGPYFDYYSETGRLKVNYNSTYEEYKEF